MLAKSRPMAYYSRVWFSPGITIDPVHNHKTYGMKTKTIVAGLAFVASAVATYFILRRTEKPTYQPIEKSHHLTDVFSKAKKANKKGAAI